MPLKLTYELLHWQAEYKSIMENVDSNLISGIDAFFDMKHKLSLLGTSSQFLAQVLHILCFLSIHCMCMSSWIGHLALYMFSIICQYGIFCLYNPPNVIDIESLGLWGGFFGLLFCSISVFAMNEKIRKEQYVINHTNA